MVDPNLFDEWKSHPGTQAVFGYLLDVAADIKSDWVNGAFKGEEITQAMFEARVYETLPHLTYEDIKRFYGQESLDEQEPNHEETDGE